MLSGSIRTYFVDLALQRTIGSKENRQTKSLETFICSTHTGHQGKRGRDKLGFLKLN
jgi:hypothetical protein